MENSDKQQTVIQNESPLLAAHNRWKNMTLDFAHDTEKEVSQGFQVPDELVPELTRLIANRSSLIGHYQWVTDEKGTHLKLIKVEVVTPNLIDNSVDIYADENNFNENTVDKNESVLNEDMPNEDVKNE